MHYSTNPFFFYYFPILVVPINWEEGDRKPPHVADVGYVSCGEGVQLGSN